MLCRVCKALEEAVRGDGLDYGVATLCSVLAGEGGYAKALRRMQCAYPEGIPCDLRRLDQARRFIMRNHSAGERVSFVDGWLQLASQEPVCGWLCNAAKGTRMEGRGGVLVVQACGKPQGYSPLLLSLEHDNKVTFVAFSPDGSTIACVSGRNVELRNAHTMELKGTLRGHSRANPQCTCSHQAWPFEVNPLHYSPTTVFSGKARVLCHARLHRAIVHPRPPVLQQCAIHPSLGVKLPIVHTTHKV